MVVLRLFLYTSQSHWWYSDYPYTHHILSGGTQYIPILITVYLLAQTIPLLITVSLVVLRLYLYSSQSLWWPSYYPYTDHSIPGGSGHFYTHHSLPGGTQTIPMLITDSLVVLRLSLYSSQSLWWPQTIPILITIYLVSQTISLLITVSLVVLRLSLYSSQSPLWYSDFPYTHHSLSGGTQTIPILTTLSLLVGHQTIPIHITFCLVIIRLNLYAS